MFELLDSMIATITVVLVMSLIVQSIQQIVKQLFSMKSKYMERELFALFAQIAYKRSIVPVKFQYEKLAARHPEIAELVGRISSRLNGIGYNDLSMLESMKKEEFIKISGDLFDAGEYEIELRDGASVSADEKNRLVERINFLHRVRSDVERWYDVTIKAFQDHYARRMKMWAFGLSAFVVVGLNANLFQIYKEFSSNKVLRAVAVKMGEGLAMARTDTLNDTSAKEIRMVRPETVNLELMRLELKKIDSLIYEQSFSLMRWNKNGDFQEVDSWRDFSGWLWNILTRNLIGWIGMTLLVGLGAPFWYDLLRTLVGVKDRLHGRAAGGEASVGGSSPSEITTSYPKQNEPPAVG